MSNRVFAFVARAAACICLLCALSAPSFASNNGGGSTNNRPPLVPDLTISQVTRVLNRYTFQYVPDEVWIQVSNIGTGGTGQYQVFVEWGAGYSNQQEFFLLPNLAPGQSVWLLVNAQGYDLWNGQFVAAVDPTNWIAESDETNNVYSHN